MSDNNEGRGFSAIKNDPRTEEQQLADYERYMAALKEPNPTKSREKPVAWAFELANYKRPDGTYTGWCPRLDWHKPNVPEDSIRNLVPLYATLSPSSPGPLSKGSEFAAWWSRGGLSRS